MQAGELVRQRRSAHGLSQQELALRAGTRQSTISRIENGHENPTVDRLDQLLLAMGERLELQAVPLAPSGAGTDAGTSEAGTMGERLEEGFALAAFASELAGRARR